MAGEAARVIAAITAATNQEKIDIASAMLQAVVLATPVGDPRLWKNPNSAPPGYVGGAARANWQVSINAATDTVIDSVDKNGGATIQRGIATAQRAQPGAAIWLVNNLPYIGRLNDGHSTQAPAGFVEAAVQTGIAAAGS